MHPIFWWIFKIFPLNHIKFPNISQMEILITFGACAALLIKSVENGHFRAFPPMKFSKGWQVCMLTITVEIPDYRKNRKVSDTPKMGCNHPKIWTRWLYCRLMQMEWQTVQTLISSPIWVYTVCPDLSIRKLRIIAVYPNVPDSELHAD